MSYIEVRNLSKEYRIAQTGKGIGGAVKALFHREYTVKQAVRNINFSVEKGEIVGYIGPNGAGKPTIGLDVVSKKMLREAIKTINREKGTTVMLTTHDMDDIEAVCDRLIMINEGVKLFDGTLEAFRKKYEREITVRLEFEKDVPDWKEMEGLSLIRREANGIEVKLLDRDFVKVSIMRLLDAYEPKNIFVREPDIEDIVELAYKDGKDTVK